ncbi:MAG: Nif11-like leader peptide family natural product precursor [Acidobacteria bacterium]|nr:Nif11-like leader peptide family natural product precursor [Acidobacteriota bacterium]
MADQGLEGFYVKVMEDPALQAQLKDAPDASSFVATAVHLGQQHGYHFTAEEVVAKLRAPTDGAEMSEKELEAVAGGYTSFGSSVLCGYCGKTSGTCSATSALPR